jgi:AcrR family transcriptional regulator
MPSIRNSDHVREACLDAARLSIIDLGWRRTTLTEVARRAGVSRMTIYRSWADMGALLGDLLRREWSELIRQEHAYGIETREQFVASIVAVTRAMRRSELYRRVIELDPHLMLPYLLERRGSAQDRLLAGYVATITAGQQTGQIRAGDPAAMARSLLLTGTGFLLSMRVMTDDGVTEDALDAEFARILDGTLTPDETRQQ